MANDPRKAMAAESRRLRRRGLVKYQVEMPISGVAIVCIEVGASASLEEIYSAAVAVVESEIDGPVEFVCEEVTGLRWSARKING